MSRSGHTVEGCEECKVPRVICSECSRERADEHDEGNHNTGECSCEEARSLCWWAWNGDRCLPLSIYDKDSPEREDV